jgi:hypothetical protein
VNDEEVEEEEEEEEEKEEEQVHMLCAHQSGKMRKPRNLRRWHHCICPQDSARFPGHLAQT